MQRYVTPIFFLLVSYIFSKLDDTPFLYSLIPFLLISILWIIFYPKYFYSTVIRNAKKMIKEGKNLGLLGNPHFIMTDEGIEDSTSNGKTSVSWSGIESLKEDQNYYYLYNSSVSTYIIPKRELNSKKEFILYLQSKLVHIENGTDI